jgi:hypothetical protein
MMGCGRQAYEGTLDDDNVPVGVAATGRVEARPAQPAERVIAASVLAGAAILIHLSIVLDFRRTISTLLARFQARGTARGTVDGILEGYLYSFGGLLFLTPVLFFCAVAASRKTKSPSPWRRAALATAFATFPVLENILVLQHATAFSYDRVKLAIPLAIIIGTSLATLSGRWRVLGAIALTAVLAQNVWAYHKLNEALSAWPEIDRRNRQAVERLQREVDLSCATIATNTYVRGYMNLLIGRGVYEAQPRDALPRLVSSRNGCAGVFIDASAVFPDLPRLQQITVTDEQGTREIPF